ncbi:hypothetical protein ED236_03600 [Pseudomethylobacillus aquaticus]|uniref:DUF3887 domain-containing protein n=1 Tax=Pseudomethylobacillus aquaticus TaxID=2676064 RepID=A0A3N0V7E2_9PROT|nr:hypothetical protein [Pseudomethylobacillus aquaticus]ROH88541.1 hypothetical protein ED236_03600 [Pseudomethylobacillus aquaticus]
MKAISFVVLFAWAGIALAEPAPVESAPAQASLAEQIPTTEKEFVSVINQYSSAQLISQFGEPSKRDDLKDRKTGEVVASIWQYQYLNTDAEGQYYQTTELDIVNDKVVMVVFMNNDGKGSPEEVKKIEIKPEM